MPGRKTAGARRALKSVPAMPSRMDVDGCPLPEDRWYDIENDVWLQPTAEDRTVARLGLVASLGAFAGRFHSVQFRPIPDAIDRGRSLATLESTRYTGAVRVPADATILERNAAIVATPKLLNNDPYGGGWIATLRLQDPSEADRRLLRAPAAAGPFRDRIRERRIRCYPAVPDVELYEIGVECSAVLAQLDQEIDRIAPGEVVLLVTDDPTSPIEMVRWSDRTGHQVLGRRTEDRLEHFLVRREADPKPRRPRT
jgi:glycine cleavage system H protein